MDWITDQIAIGDCLERAPDGATVIDLRDVPDHCRIPCERIDAFVVQVLNLTRNGGKVFVHCIGGVSRSPSFVAAYLAFKMSISAKEALEMIRRKRPKIQPHAAQVASVEEWLHAYVG